MYGWRTHYQLRLLLSLTFLSLGSAELVPCCPNNTDLIYTSENHTYLITCSDTSPLYIHSWCEKYYATVDYKENNNEEFKNQKYCVGKVANNSFPSKNPLSGYVNEEVGLVCFPENDSVSPPFTLYAICILISAVFLLATIAVYLILPELRDLQGKCVLCFIISLMIGYISLAYLQLPYTAPDSDTVCVVIAFTAYFWLLSAFFWLNINSFNVWRSAVLSHINMSEKRLMLFYLLPGWGIPLIFLLFALVTHHIPGDHIQPNFGKSSCWFKGSLELWSFFYGPVLFLLILNIVYFISTAHYLWYDYKTPNPMPRVKSLRTKFCIYLKLLLVMGITWIFEILSSVDDSPWYVTDLLNCFQGVIIFIVMIVLRKRVWRGLAAKRILGLETTSCWKKLEDEETGTVDEDQLSGNSHSQRKPYELVDGNSTLPTNSVNGL